MSLHKKHCWKQRSRLRNLEVRRSNWVPPKPDIPTTHSFRQCIGVWGALLMDGPSNRLDMKWIASDGVVRDRFTIVKDVNRNDSIQIEKGQSVDLKASYVGNYVWNTGATTGTIDVSPDITAEYVVRDELTCLK